MFGKNNNQNFHRRVLIFFFCVFNFSFVVTSHASGFIVPGGWSVAGMGMADAIVANPDEIGALAYNPAAMSFHKGTNLVLGLTAVWPDTNVTPQGGSGKISDNSDSPFLIPTMYLMSSVDDNWSLGLAINTPFGLETNWPTGTFPEFAGPLTPFAPTKSRLEMVNLNPNIAYRINEHSSIAVGLDYYRVLEATTDSQGVGLSGDGDDVGWNAAFMYALDQWSFGLSYQSSVTVGIDGEFDATQSFGFKVNSTTELDFPDIFRIGVRYQANDKLAVEFDIDRIGWHSFDEIVVKSAGDVPLAGISSGDVLAVTTNNWSDTYSYHIGGTYQLLPATQLRLGYTLNQNPQPEAHYSPRFPNAKRHLFSIGLKQEYQEWDFEGGLMYGKWENREINNSQPYAGGDANGTTAYNGKYEIDGILAGIGANFYF